MSEQEKTGAEPKKSIYTLDFDMMLRRADGEKFKTKGELLDELNTLLARAEKAEGDLKTIISNQNNFLKQMYIAFDTAAAEIYHPDIGAAERKPMTPHERIEWLGKSRDEWKARAEKAEAERDELMRRLSEARVKEHWETSEGERQLLRRAEAAEADRDQWKRRTEAVFADFDLSQQKNLINPVDWNRVRIDAAIAAMQGMLADTAYDPGREMAATAVAYADDLVLELKEREQE